MAKLVVNSGQINTQHPYIKEYIRLKFTHWFETGKDWSYPAQVYVGLHYVKKFDFPISCSYIESHPGSQHLYVNPGNQRLLYAFMYNQSLDALMIRDELVKPDWFTNEQEYLGDILLHHHSLTYAPIDPSWKNSQEEYIHWKNFCQTVFREKIQPTFGTVKIYYGKQLVVNIPNKHNNTSQLTVINTNSCFGVLEALDYMTGKQEKVFNEFTIRKYLTN